MTSYRLRDGTLATYTFGPRSQDMAYCITLAVTFILPIKTLPMSVLNVAGYKFVQLQDLPELKARILAEGVQRSLRGTVLLAEEGINLFLAGEPEPVRNFIAWLRTDSRFADFTVKDSWSATTPFRKFLVKLKREIITMKHPTIRPENERAPAVDSATLKRWLDQGHDDNGEPFLLLDTRNIYEVERGTFTHAVTPKIEHFSQFPAVVQSLPETAKQQTIVSFCTGGIRCEKAALYMREVGFKKVLQLDGGILKYFEETGGAHYEGACFVFDERRAVEADLSPSLASSGQ